MCSHGLWPLINDGNHVPVEVNRRLYPVFDHTTEGILPSESRTNHQVISLIPVDSLHVLVRIWIVHRILDCLGEAAMRTVPCAELPCNAILPSSLVAGFRRATRGLVAEIADSRADPGADGNDYSEGKESNERVSFALGRGSALRADRSL